MQLILIFPLLTEVVQTSCYVFIVKFRCKMLIEIVPYWDKISFPKSFCSLNFHCTQAAGQCLNNTINDRQSDILNNSRKPKESIQFKLFFVEEKC